MRALTPFTDRPPATRSRRRGLIRAVAVLLLVPLALPWGAAASAGDAEKPPTPVFDPQSVDHIDPAIRAEMLQQAKLQPAVDALHEASLKTKDSGLAGVAYEGSGVTLYYSGALPPTMSAAVARARAYGSVTVKPAAHSFATLQRNSDKITSAAVKAGSDIQAVHLAYDGSGLTVERLPGDAAATMAGKRARLGLAAAVPAQQIVKTARVDVPVTITTGTETIEPGYSRTDDFAPWNGGARWESWRNGAGRLVCTTGFGTKNSAGQRFVLTAAHCATPPDYAQQGLGATLEYMGPFYDQSVSYDLGIIRANGSSTIFDGTNTTSNTRHVAGWAHWSTNQLVCQSGITSGTVCGIRQQNSMDKIMGCCDSDGDQGYTIRGLIRAPRDGGGIAFRKGDSGGPVFTISGADVLAKGISSLGADTSTLYFQDWADVTRIWGLTPF
ncbi:trypsin-like serine protease [Asanoa ishikariensis]|nr:trypsin-like serine protease [Asanoa ishikariensis]